MEDVYIVKSNTGKTTNILSLKMNKVNWGFPTEVVIINKKFIASTKVYLHNISVKCYSMEMCVKFRGNSV